MLEVVRDRPNDRDPEPALVESARVGLEDRGVEAAALVETSTARLSSASS